MMTNRQIYIRTVLNLYAQIPGAPLLARPCDRVLAHLFFDRQIPIDIVETALLLGAARRMFHRHWPPPPIRALDYFEPIVEELLAEPPQPDSFDVMDFTPNPEP